MDESGNDGQLLLHTMGIGADRLSKVFGKAKEIGIILDALFPFLLGNAIYIGNKIEILHPAEKFVQVGIIRQIGDFAFAADGIFPDGHAIHIDLSFLKLQDPAAGFDRRCFAGAVMANEPIDLPRANVQRKIIHRLFITVCFGQVFDSEHFAPSDRMFNAKYILQHRYRIVNASAALFKQS